MSDRTDGLIDLLHRLPEADKTTVLAALGDRYRAARGSAGKDVASDLLKSLTAWMGFIVMFAPDIVPILEELLPQVVGQHAASVVLAIIAKIVGAAIIYGRIRAKVLGGSA